MTGAMEETLAAPLTDVPLPAPTPKQRTRSTLQTVLLVFSVSLAMVLSVACNMILTIALPVVGRELGIASTDLQWPVTSYALAFGCLLLLLGRLADIFGRKRAFLFGAFIFGTFNIACGLSKSLVQLSVFRALVGVGAAAAIPAGAGIIAHTFPATSRARAIAFTCFSAGAPIGSGLGTTLAGVMTQYSSWRNVFYLFAGLSYVPVVLAYFVVDRDELDPQRDKRVDWLGGLLSTAAITLLTFGLGAGSTALPDKWATPYVIVSLVLGGVLLFAFLAWEHFLAVSPRLSVPPLMPLEIWTRGRIGANLALMFVGWIAFQPLLFWTTLFFQEYQELSPIQTTVRFLPTAVAGLLVNFVFAALVPYVYGWALLALGCLSGALAALLMAIIDPSAPYWQYAFPALILSVMLADFCFATTMLHIASVALPNEQSLANAMMQVCTQLGVAIGLAVTTVVDEAVAAKSAAALGIALDGAHTNVPKASYLAGLRAAQWTSCAFGFLGFLVAVLLLQPVKVLGHRRTKKERLMAEASEDEKGAAEKDVEECATPVNTLREVDGAKLGLDDDVVSDKIHERGAAASS